MAIGKGWPLGKDGDWARTGIGKGWVLGKDMHWARLDFEQGWKYYGKDRHGPRMGMMVRIGSVQGWVLGQYAGMGNGKRCVLGKEGH